MFTTKFVKSIKVSDTINFLNHKQEEQENCDYHHIIQGVPKNVALLYGCCGGAAHSIISGFTQLHSSSFNLDFETLYESIC